MGVITTPQIEYEFKIMSDAESAKYAGTLTKQKEFECKSFSGF